MLQRSGYLVELYQPFPLSYFCSFMRSFLDFYRNTTIQQGLARSEESGHEVLFRYFPYIWYSLVAAVHTINITLITIAEWILDISESNVIKISIFDSAVWKWQATFQSFFCHFWGLLGQFLSIYMYSLLS